MNDVEDDDQSIKIDLLLLLLLWQLLVNLILRLFHYQVIHHRIKMMKMKMNMELDKNHHHDKILIMKYILWKLIK